MKPVIFLDLDGVLADFVRGSCKIHGIKPKWENHGFWRHELTDKEFWARINSRGAKFWADLPKYSWADQLVGMAEEHGSRVFFCTSVDPRNPSAAQGKLSWLKKHFGRRARRAIITKKKYMVSGPVRVLVDDSYKHCKQWSNWGGKGVLFPQPWTRAWSPEYESGGQIAYVREKLKHYSRKLDDQSEN